MNAHASPNSVLAAHRVALEQHRALEPELQPVDVDGVAADGDAVPPLLFLFVLCLCFFLGGRRRWFT
jgi:hypothetical protein